MWVDKIRDNFVTPEEIKKEIKKYKKDPEGYVAKYGVQPPNDDIDFG